ncbi:unnamed protein product [Coregonus sp. 'balchen']|nr:unnamed protein product [Coregonus sp. 'balchen']
MVYSFHFYCIYHLIMKSSLTLLCLVVWVNVDASSAQTEEYKEGAILLFSCNFGFVPAGRTSYLCEKQKWVVLPKPCELPEETANGHYTIHLGDDFVFGAVLKYTCNDGCVPEATDGRVVVSGLPDDGGLIQYGHELRFSCPNPEHQLEGNPQVVCAAGGRWNSRFPTCEDVTCEAVERINHVNVIGVPQNNSTMKYGHRLQFECSNPSHVLKGESEVVCSTNGQWSHSFPICDEPKDFCGPPPHLINGDTVNRARERYRNGVSVHYVCQKYYILDSPSSYKTCSDGIWIGPMTCLKPCTVDEELMNAQNIQFKHPPDTNKLYATHGDHITFKCSGNSRLSPSSVDLRQQCINGVMNLPHCQ